MYQCNLCCYAPELCETMRNYAKLCETMPEPAGLPSQSRPACLRRAGRLAFAEASSILTGRYVGSTFVEDQREFVEHFQYGKQIG